MNDPVALTAAWVRLRMGGEGSHDWWHIQRVWALARELAIAESTQDNVRKPDFVVVELAALLHDIADAKFHGGDELIGPRLAREWLEGRWTGSCDGMLTQGQLDAATIEHIVSIIATMSFRHATAGFVPDLSDREYAVVRDADRLDAMGAIGIARAFAFGGARGRALHDPDPENGSASTIAHFHEKLLKLKDLMLTDAGHRLAGERHDFMVAYLQRFMAEWDGRC